MPHNALVSRVVHTDFQIIDIRTGRAAVVVGQRLPSLDHLGVVTEPVGDESSKRLLVGEVGRRLDEESRSDRPPNRNRAGMATTRSTQSPSATPPRLPGVAGSRHERARQNDGQGCPNVGAWFGVRCSPLMKEEHR
jgi:hypothetical protein